MQHEKEAVIRFKRTKAKKLGEPPVQTPALTVRLRDLTAKESFAADNLNAAMADGGEPTRTISIKTYAVCAVRAKRVGAGEWEAVDTLTRASFEHFIDGLSRAELDALGIAYLGLSGEVAEAEDP